MIRFIEVFLVRHEIKSEINDIQKLKIEINKQKHEMELFQDDPIFAKRADQLRIKLLDQEERVKKQLERLDKLQKRGNKLKWF